MVKFQPDSALIQWFKQRTENAKGSRKPMIVALARKLIIRDASIHGDDTDVDERNPIGDGLHAAAPDKRKTAKTDAAAEVA
jgi:hypothetical protein